AAAYANYTGVAPVEIASADSVRHRLSRYGDRELNSALHTIAMIQIRMRGSRGRVYYEKKITGKVTERSQTVPQTTPGRPVLANHDPRRKTHSRNPTHRPSRPGLTNTEVSRVWGRFFLEEDGRHHVEALPARGS
uniref:transposase n=1 Tax=Nocardia araoensis TaxID=228600 RepID=UPI0012F622AE